MDPMAGLIALAGQPRSGRWRAVWLKSAGAVLVAVCLAIGIYLAAIAAVPFGARLFVQTIELAARALVWIVLAFEGGLDFWGVLAALGRRIVELLATPRVTVVLVGVELVGAVAVYALHRLLRSDKESLR